MSEKLTNIQASFNGDNTATSLIALGKGETSTAFLSEGTTGVRFAVAKPPFNISKSQARDGAAYCGQTLLSRFAPKRSVAFRAAFIEFIGHGSDGTPSSFDECLTATDQACRCLIPVLYNASVRERFRSQFRAMDPYNTEPQQEAFGTTIVEFEPGANFGETEPGFPEGEVCFSASEAQLYFQLVLHSSKRSLGDAHFRGYAYRLYFKGMELWGCHFYYAMAKPSFPIKPKESVPFNQKNFL